MNAAKYSFWLFCILIALSCSGFYFASSPLIKKLDEKTLAQTADTIMTGVEIFQYNETGQLMNALKTPKIIHISENNTHILTNPQILVTQSEQPPFTIQSGYAKSIQGGKEITFYQNVVIQQKNGPKQSTFKTNILHYFSKVKLATTTEHVRIEDSQSVIQAQGMKAYLNEKRIQLLGKAHAIYEPKHS